MIFDLDGTLLNTIGDLAAAANHTLAEMGFAPHTEEEYKYMVGNGIPKLIERFLSSRAPGQSYAGAGSPLFSLLRRAQGGRYGSVSRHPRPACRAARRRRKTGRRVQ
ncbi:MAG: HAD hydrolase-like protein [Ruthenibacterium lactatiformans]